ncbi:hypothetical protein BKH46_08005 [Helicobacter sp. 12S02634-8]|uniref:hypothetical protein n=1 Tax=Helicobacter sp. 12S02634-8 TaxID=1476199 RepID=UPI000BA64B38|nr:hypothetical protein [Helicobacter sp. 12S02634-8]PAF46320.1 hypothetical protein BKH46_08005 [Helicobacter sp. 12S02634-8]
MRKEQLGIYNVTFNEKRATPIQADIELIEEAIIESIVMYVRGFHNRKKNKGLGAKHIKLHLEKDAQGYISIEELVNLGKSIREYSKLFKESFTDKNGAKIYEWENENRVRFRAVIDKILPDLVATHLANLPSSNQIISFYSDRNLNKPMGFKNPLVAKHYEESK